MRRLAALIGAVLVVASVWYVQAPPRTAAAYRDEAKRTAETLRAQVETARLWIESVHDGSATHQAATVAFQETEADAIAAASGFAAHDPPSDTDALRRDLTALGDDVESALGDLRILAHRERWAELPERPTRLAELSRRLDDLAQRAGSP